MRELNLDRLVGSDNCDRLTVYLIRYLETYVLRVEVLWSRLSITHIDVDRAPKWKKIKFWEHDQQPFWATAVLLCTSVGCCRAAGSIHSKQYLSRTESTRWYREEEVYLSLLFAIHNEKLCLLVPPVPPKTVIAFYTQVFEISSSDAQLLPHECEAQRIDRVLHGLQVAPPISLASSRASNDFWERIGFCFVATELW